MPFDSNIKNLFVLKVVTAVLIVAILSCAFAFGQFEDERNLIVINDNGETKEIVTLLNTVEDVLNENNFVLRPEDQINLPLSTEIQYNNCYAVDIVRSVPVTVTVDGESSTIYTVSTTVQEVLDEMEIKLGALDAIWCRELDDPIESDMEIRIVRFFKTEVTKNITLPYQTVRVKSDDMALGTEEVIQKGENGLRVKEYVRITNDMGKSGEKLTYDHVEKQPVKEIIKYGTLKSYDPARGDKFLYREKIVMKSTAYTPSFEECRKNPGDPGYRITASGLEVQKGIIAVDPAVIPLGTWVYVEVIGKTHDYGFAIAADTGYGVDGKQIDVFMEDKSDALIWGIKDVNVYILANYKGTLN